MSRAYPQPAGHPPLGSLVPHTFALRVIRLVLIDGRGITDGQVGRDMATLACYALTALVVGILLLRRAGRTGGLSVVG